MPFADADHSLRPRRGLVAHVGAIRQVVGAELPHEELIEKRCLVAGAPRRIKNRFVRTDSSFSSLAISAKASSHEIGS